MATDAYGNYSSARGSKASSKFTRLKKFFLRQEDEKRQFMLEKRDGCVYVRPVPKFR